jgi:outer membrane protein assembly factor BamB
MTCFAVIPSLVLFTPLALLAALLPAVFGHWLQTLKRWSALLGIGTVSSSLYLASFVLREPYKGHWWTSPAAVWTALAITATAGTAWAWRRWRKAPVGDVLANSRPQVKEHVLLGLLSLTGVWSMVLCVMIQHPLLHPILTVWAVAWTGSLYQIYLSWRLRSGFPAKPLPSTETVMLGTLALVSAAFGVRASFPDPDVLWTFVGDDRGSIQSSACVDGDRVYVAAALDQGALPHGELYCLAAATGRKLWKFDDDRRMKPVVASPALRAGRIYVGEGFFDAGACRLYCIDAATGKKLWHFQTAGAIASAPCVEDGRVFFAAGSDGLYCLDAVTGAMLWHLDQVRSQVTPALDGRRLYAGTASGKNSEILCLNPATGQAIWRTSVDLPVTGPPTVAGNHVLFGLGNGSRWRSADAPAGAVICAGAGTGRISWRFPTSDAVFAQPAVGAETVYCTSRDQHCYAIDLQHGTLRWQQPLGSPVVASPVLQGRRILVLSTLGRLCRFDAITGEPLSSFDTAAHSQSKPRAFAAPTLSDGRIYFGAGLADLITGFAPTLYCLRDRDEQNDE